MTISTRAPAKINLSLHVLRRRADGYHDLESFVAFAGSGDLLTFQEGEELTLHVHGPTAEHAGHSDDNLVLKAARALAERVPNLRLGHFALTKRLPVAAGIGGGSSDAAAALRLLARANGLALDDPRVFAAAVATGADVPVCLESRARMMGGIGDVLGPPAVLPPLMAVLVNPGVKVETRDVFRRMGLPTGEDNALPTHPALDGKPGRAAMLRGLGAARNDMQQAAGDLAPVIGDVLGMLERAPGCRLARMSGSGATCFGLFDDCRSAAAALRAIKGEEPTWWVKATVLR